jgi:hypothetical protein
MKPTQTSSKVLPLLAFGPHPDDVEFGCSGVVLNETRAYIESQLTRARLLGARTAVDYAMALYPNDPILFGSLKEAGISARGF